MMGTLANVLITLCYVLVTRTRQSMSNQTTLYRSGPQGIGAAADAAADGLSQLNFDDAGGFREAGGAAAAAAAAQQSGPPSEQQEVPPWACS